MATGSSSPSAAARPTRRVRRRDVRFVKDGVARALRTLRAAAGPVPEDQVVPLSPQMVGLRFAAAALGRRRRGAGDRPLRTGGAGVGADEPGRVDYRRDARRELEDEAGPTAMLHFMDAPQPDIAPAPAL